MYIAGWKRPPNLVEKCPNLVLNMFFLNLISGLKRKYESLLEGLLKFLKREYEGNVYSFTAFYKFVVPPPTTLDPPRLINYLVHFYSFRFSYILVRLKDSGIFGCRFEINLKHVYIVSSEPFMESDLMV